MHVTGQRGFITNNKKNSKNDFWVIWSIFVFLVFPLFWGGSNPKAGGWI